MNLVYETLLDSDENLIARMPVAFASLRDMPGMFERVRQSSPPILLSMYH